MILSLGLMSQTAFCVDERVAIIKRNALIKVRDRELWIAVDQKRAATFEVSFGVIRVDLDCPVKISQSPIEIQSIRSGITAVQIGLSNVVVAGGQLRRQVAGYFVVGDSAIQVATRAFSFAAIQISLGQLWIDAQGAIILDYGACDIALTETLDAMLDVFLRGLGMLCESTKR